jgi:hypothetical protein
MNKVTNGILVKEASVGLMIPIGTSHTKEYGSGIDPMDVDRAEEQATGRGVYTGVGTALGATALGALIGRKFKRAEPVFGSFGKEMRQASRVGEGVVGGSIVGAGLGALTGMAAYKSKLNQLLAEQGVKKDQASTFGSTRSRYTKEAV